MMEESRARAALLLLSAYPFALFFSAAYTESLFLLTALAAWFHFRRKEYLAATGWGLLTGLTPAERLLSQHPARIAGARHRDASSRGPSEGGLWRRLSVAAMPGIGMLLFTAYLHQMTGIWFVWSKTHAAWGRVLGGETPLASFAGFGSDGLLGFASDHPYDLLNALGLLLALLPIRAIWRLSPAWTMFVLVNVLVPLAAGGLLSMGRLTSTLFPVFLACGMSMPPRLATAATVGFAVVQDYSPRCSPRGGGCIRLSSQLWLSFQLSAHSPLGSHFCNVLRHPGDSSVAVLEVCDTARPTAQG